MVAHVVRCQIISFFFFLLGYAAFLGAFGSHYWMEEGGGSNWGLWRMCSPATGCTSTVGTNIMTVPFIGAQALMCVSLALGAVSLGSYLAWISTRSDKACVIVWVTGTASAFCTAMALICWGSESLRYYGANVLSWSFWLALASCALTILNSGITACSTGCGTTLDEPSRVVYGSGTHAVPAEQYVFNGPHDTTDQTYSDITHSEYSMGNMNPQARPGPRAQQPRRKY